MRYRKFGKLDWQASVLGFGLMRLPQTASGDVDRIEAIRMVHHAIDQGVNYLDTAYPYHDGQSESVLGQALKGGYRRKVRIATKLPSWLIETAADFDRYFEAQLERLQTDHIDFYLLHALSRRYWPKIAELGGLDWARRKISQGRIGCLGFSFHDQYEVFEEIVGATDLWSFCQIQYNYMDEEYQAGTRGLQLAAEHGLPVVVMEPIRGGRLARNFPSQVQALYNAAQTARSPADLALQWVWNQPEATVVLSGMSTMAQLRENLASAAACGPGTLTAAELRLIDQIAAAYNDLCPIDCTDCRYCLPCSSGVDIPKNLEIYNNAVMYNAVTIARRSYQWMDAEDRADRCTQCRECLEKCPQGIDIPLWLEKTCQLMDGAEPCRS